MNQPNQYQKVTTTSFIKVSNTIHNNKYDYSLVEYQGSKTKVSIICLEHGEFTQTPNKHTQGRGCPKCANKTRCRFPKEDTTQFIEKANIVHGNIYNYSKSIYKSNHHKVTITCDIHGDFTQTPANHKTGQGCPDCKIAGFKYQLKGILYYICIDETYYKIGITNRSVQKRFSNNDLNRIRIVNTWEFDNGRECYDKEQSILLEYNDLKLQQSNSLLESVKNTEIFIKDVLQIDKTKSGSGK